MFSAPFDMERAFIQACLKGDSEKLFTIARKDTVIKVGEHQYTIEEAVQELHNVKVNSYTIDLLKVEYDSEENRFVRYNTAVISTGTDGEEKNDTYAVSTEWTLNNGNYFVTHVQVLKQTN